MSGFNAGSPAEDSAPCEQNSPAIRSELVRIPLVGGQERAQQWSNEESVPTYCEGQFGIALLILSGDTTCLEGKNWGESSALLHAS